MNPADLLPDVISAAGLVLAVLAALYTLWLGDVNAALSLVAKTDGDDRGPQRVQVRRAIFTKALPLAGASSAAVLILVARALAILGEVYHHHSNWRFDDIKALFVLTIVLLSVLASVAFVQLLSLIAKRRELG
jgi:hypothetical protein